MEPVAQTTPAPSITDRIKAAFLNPQSTAQPGNQPDPDNDVSSPNVDESQPNEAVAPKTADPKAPVQKKADVEAEPDADEAQGEADVPEDDAQHEELKLSTLEELAEATGLELDKLLDLELPTKIDGKDGKARLRDLQRSYQLDGHINQKLATLDNDRKALATEREQHTRAAAERLLKLDAGAQTLERALAAEFATVDWQKLQAEDPLAFNAQYVAYQQRYAVLQDIGKEIAAERDAARKVQEDQFREYVDEQKKLFAAKIPEWSDTTKRDKDRADIAEMLQAYGYSKEEAVGRLNNLIDHRDALMARDLLRFARLQKSKPATLLKVKAAPKLLKPGTQQSRAAQNKLQLTNERARLRATGRPRDAASVLKRLGVV